MKEQAKINMQRIKSNLEQLKANKNRQKNIWNIKKNFFPKVKPSLPVAKRNASGKIVTDTEELKELYINHFVIRLLYRPIIS